MRVIVNAGHTKLGVGTGAIYRKLGLNIMKDHIDIQDWGISYAQTSISRK